MKKHAFADGHNAPVFPSETHDTGPRKRPFPHVVAVGPSTWRETVANMLESSLRRMGATTRFYRDEGFEATALEHATWLILVIDPIHIVYENDILRLAAQKKEFIRIGVVCLGSVQPLLMRHGRLVNSGHLSLAVVTSHQDSALLPMRVTERLVVDDLESDSNRIARSILGHLAT